MAVGKKKKLKPPVGAPAKSASALSKNKSVVKSGIKSKVGTKKSALRVQTRRTRRCCSNRLLSLKLLLLPLVVYAKSFTSHIWTTVPTSRGGCSIVAEHLDEIVVHWFQIIVMKSKPCLDIILP